ncbi:MAG: hypothetical protein KF718_27910 [Polyangiaceae bacterium]|nr:hypothetical protein [Polyangiaceae bacterium]
MRLGVLGPAHDRIEALERAARFLHREAGADRIVYLGLDPGLDGIVRSWAETLVGGEASEESLFERAAARCAQAPHGEIELFLRAERDREALRAFESLPRDGSRLVELLAGRVVVMIHDKAQLDEDDIASATVLVFGKSADPLIKAVGSRWFVAPGPLGDFGILLLEDREDGVYLSLYDSVCREIRHERLFATGAAHLQVSKD